MEGAGKILFGGPGSPGWQDVCSLWSYLWSPAETKKYPGIYPTSWGRREQSPGRREGERGQGRGKQKGRERAWGQRELENEQTNNVLENNLFPLSRLPACLLSPLETVI